MTIVVSPSLQELRAIVGLADGYLQQADDLDEGLHVDLGTAVLDCVQWLDALESLTPASEIAMAQAVLDKHKVASNAGPEIAQVLFLSTAHIEQDTDACLNADMNFGLTVFQKSDFGWFIYVNSPDLLMSQLPDGLFACVKYAKDLGCSWICLNMDAPIDGNLPSYDW